MKSGDGVIGVGETEAKAMENCLAGIRSRFASCFEKEDETIPEKWVPLYPPFDLSQL